MAVTSKEQDAVAADFVDTLKGHPKQDRTLLSHHFDLKSVGKNLHASNVKPA